MASLRRLSNVVGRTPVGSRLRPEALDEALRMAVRTSVVAGAVTGAVAYAVGALRGAANYLPGLEVEWHGSGRGASSVAEQVVTRVEVDADGRRTITRTTTKVNEDGQRRVQKETLKGNGNSSARSFLQGLPFPTLPFGLGDRLSLPSSESIVGRAMGELSGVVATSAMCALFTLPVARSEWRASMFGTRALTLRQSPGVLGTLIGLRILVISWLSGTLIAGTVGSGGIALVGVPAAMIAGLPVLATGLIFFPFSHRELALRLVRKCIL